MEFIKISKELAETNNMNYQKDNLIFFSRKNINGDYVCALQSLIDFPELFLNQTIEIIDLDIEKDFEKPENLF